MAYLTRVILIVDKSDVKRRNTIICLAHYSGPNIKYTEGEWPQKNGGDPPPPPPPSPHGCMNATAPTPLKYVIKLSWLVYQMANTLDVNSPPLQIEEWPIEMQVSAHIP